MLKEVAGFFSTVIRYRELIFFLVYREFRIRYKQTLLGVAWAVIQPFSQMLIFTFVFFYFAKFRSEGTPYPIFVLAGLLPWTMFQGALTRGIPIFVNYGNVITKIYFPRVILLIAATLGLLVDFICAYLAFLCMYFYFGLPFHAGLLFCLLLMVVQFFLTIGILCFLSTVTVYFRDLTYAIPLFLQLWMFTTPVVYSIQVVPPHFRVFYDLNPMVGLIHNFRQAILNGSLNWTLMLETTLISLGIFMLGYVFLKKKETDLADSI